MIHLKGEGQASIPMRRTTHPPAPLTITLASWNLMLWMRSTVATHTLAH
jgi:hypothetical protein